MGFPFILLPSSFALPRSLTSNAIALARRVDVEFKLKLIATRKFRAPTAVAPLLEIFPLHEFGPKSGLQSSEIIFSGRPSYSPDLQFARFFLSSFEAAFS